MKYAVTFSELCL